MKPGPNHLIATLLPFIPKGLVRRFAGRYIAGEATHEALEVAHQMNKRGFEATIDILGEHTTAEGDAIAIADTIAQITLAIAIPKNTLLILLLQHSLVKSPGQEASQSFL